MPSGVPASLTRNCGWSWRFRLRVASFVGRGTLIAYVDAGANKSARPRTLSAERFIVGSFVGVSAHPSGWRCASTIQSHLSTPREISMKMSLVSSSLTSSLSSMALRMSLPNAASAEERASTCCRPPPIVRGYSASVDRFATDRAVPSTAPPSWTARSAIRSTYSSTSSFTLSNSSWRAMKCGPFTFQCACFVCVCRSMASASRALHRSIICRRVASGRSFFVGYIGSSSRCRLMPGRPSRCGRPWKTAPLQRPHECHQVLFLRVGQLRLQHQIEELDGVVERQKAPVVQVGRRVLDAAQRERLDRAVAVHDQAVDHLLLEKALQLQIVHRVVGVMRRRVAGGALALAEEHLLSAQLGLGGLDRIELAVHDAQLGGGREVEQFLHLRHEVHLAAALQDVDALLRGDDRVAVEVRGALLELGEVLDAGHGALRAKAALGIHASQARWLDAAAKPLRPLIADEMRSAVRMPVGVAVEAGDAAG